MRAPCELDQVSLSEKKAELLANIYPLAYAQDKENFFIIKNTF